MIETTLRRSFVDVSTQDGVADAYLVRPEGAPGSAVLLFMDGIGLRPRLQEMADRIAEQGHAVLVPNVFYRSGRAPVIPDIVARLQGEDRATVFAELRPMIEALTPELAERDTRAYVEHLDGELGRAVPLATVGYCMGGALSLRAAAQLSERVVATASFHGGNLAPDDPAGPQHQVGRISGKVYAAHADADPSMPAEQIARLEAALDAAGLAYTSEVYAGTSHGFTMSDMPVHSEEGEQRHWTALLGLLGRTMPVG